MIANYPSLLARPTSQLRRIDPLPDLLALSARYLLREFASDLEQCRDFAPQFQTARSLSFLAIGFSLREAFARFVHSSVSRRARPSTDRQRNNSALLAAI